MCGLFTYIAMGSFVLQGVYGFSPQAYGLVFAANACGIVLAGRLSALLVGRLGPRRLLSAAVVIGAVAAAMLLAGVLLSRSVWLVLAPLLVFVSCIGLILPNATGLALARQGAAAGSASAALGLIQFTIGAVVPLLASMFGVTSTVMAVTMVATSVTAVFAHFLVPARPPAGTK
jgi:MFS transporter, DHA1 family, multidrug resistance protein